MKIFAFLLGTIYLFFPVIASAQATDVGEVSLINSYRLGPGDVIDIQVFDEPDLSGQFKLNEDGVVHYAFVGEFNLSGTNMDEVQKLLDAELRGDYLLEPRVRVAMAQYRQFFMKGAIKKPGGYAFQLGLTVKKAVSIAGGLTERASARKIYRVPNGGLESERRKVEMDDPLEPGDTLTVEESFF